MVQVLPAVPNFGSQLAQVLSGVGGDIGEGLKKRQAGKKFESLWQQIQGSQGQPQTGQQSPEQMQASQMAQGQGQQIPQNISPLQMVQLSKAASDYLGPEQSKVLIDQLSEEKKSAREFSQKKELLERKLSQQKEGKYYEKNEPKLNELADTQRNLRIQNARFERLENLFQDPSKFPSATMAAALSKEGQLRPIFGAQLSPEAQEAVKLIQDELSGAKDTFGARVTNFDVGQYLKRLPSLMNTPEGRTRVLRDLKLINQINQFQNEELLKIFDEHGGPGSIPFSTAERIFEKQNKDKLKEWHDEFVEPTKKKFSGLDQADPKKLMGRKIRDSSTGEVYVSDGNEWKLEGQQ